MLVIEAVRDPVEEYLEKSSLQCTSSPFKTPRPWADYNANVSMMTSSNSSPSADSKFSVTCMAFSFLWLRVHACENAYIVRVCIFITCQHGSQCM
jgi:hypothetical protein